MAIKDILIDNAKDKNEITQQFIEYFCDYHLEEQDEWNIDDMDEFMGDYVCKYCDDQDHVNDVLEEIDEVMLEAFPCYLD